MKLLRRITIALVGAGLALVLSLGLGGGLGLSSAGATTTGADSTNPTVTAFWQNLYNLEHLDGYQGIVYDTDTQSVLYGGAPIEAFVICLFADNPAITYGLHYVGP